MTTPDTALKIAAEMEKWGADNWSQDMRPAQRKLHHWAARLRALRPDLDPAGGEGECFFSECPRTEGECAHCGKGQLLPCPFCGGAGKLDRCPISGGWFAYCDGTCQIGYGHAWHPDKNKAIEYWNRRT